MKEQKSIPASKVQRAGKFLRTGVKVSGNYIKHYTKKVVTGKANKEDLDKANAEDIYETLSQLKGSALKAAQMLSMERNILPDAYADVFSLAQHNAPPLSGPLIVKTFRQYIKKSPHELFDKFEMQASHAASIGQVHKAWKNGKTFAVKIQYPGVAESVKSDLRMVKPFALTILKVKEKEIAPYMNEVETKLMEETDYELELRNSVEMAEKCAHLPNLFFANYYPEFSSKRILTMDWLEGITLGEFIKTSPSQAMRNKIGQTLWDFYGYQMHALRKTHSDPHPGNFLVTEDGRLGAIDFGCTKKIDNEFYQPYFDLVSPNVMNNPEELEKRFRALQMIHDDDTQQEKDLYVPIFQKMISMLCLPFQSPTFDFGNDEYFKEIYDYGESLARRPELRKIDKPRGVTHVIYINRTFFGLFQLLNNLKAEVNTQSIFDNGWAKWS